MDRRAPCTVQDDKMKFEKYKKTMDRCCRAPYGVAKIKNKNTENLDMYNFAALVPLQVLAEVQPICVTKSY